MTLDDLFQLAPYSLAADRKEEAVSEILSDLTRLHYRNSPEYARILDALNFDPTPRRSVVEQPFIPTRLFKEYELRSVPKERIVKTLTSSGSTGQAVSKIFLDADSVRRQTKTLNEIISSFIGKKRLPLLLLDTESIKKDRSAYSARGAGIIGFSIFGRNPVYALDAETNVDVERVARFFDERRDEPILMFGYTYLIWLFLILPLEKMNVRFNAKNVVLFHIGGWKKLKDVAVDAAEFNRRVCARFGDVRVYNYYGMAEQLGSVFVECECGRMHCSNYSDVVVRRPRDFSAADVGERGLLQVLSTLPTSYPGHSLLTEDEGEILGVDDCPCGRKGRTFKIWGRVKNAEIRGCGDTYERR